jgi:hypothetical protein
MRLLLLGLVCAGCSFRAQVTPDGMPGHDGPPSEAGRDIDAPDMQYCYGVAPTMICLASEPTGVTSTFGSPAQPLDTDTSTFCRNDVLVPAGNTLCVAAYASVTLGAAANVTLTGSRPLVVIATGDISIAGTIDVASHFPAVKAAAAAVAVRPAAALPAARTSRCPTRPRCAADAQVGPAQAIWFPTPGTAAVRSRSSQAAP